MESNYLNMGSGECVDASAVRPQRRCFGNSHFDRDDEDLPSDAVLVSVNQPAQCQQLCSQESSCHAFEAGIGSLKGVDGVGFCHLIFSDDFVCPDGWSSSWVEDGYVFSPVRGTNSHNEFKTCYKKNAVPVDIPGKCNSF